MERVGAWREAEPIFFFFFFNFFFHLFAFDRLRLPGRVMTSFYFIRETNWILPSFTEFFSQVVQFVLFPFSIKSGVISGQDLIDFVLLTVFV